MTDPVSGEMASQAAREISEGTEAVEEVSESDPASDFSEMLQSRQEDGPGVEATEGADETMEVDGAEEVDRVQEVSETELDDFVQQILHEESNIQQMMEESMNGGEMGQEEMLQMQAVIYSYSQRVDLTTKVVESATGGIEQVMNTQV